MTWKYFFTVDHVLESLDSDGKFWCFFPSHGNQKFFSRTWIFHYFFFHDMVPSRRLPCSAEMLTGVYPGRDFQARQEDVLTVRVSPPSLAVEQRHDPRMAATSCGRQLRS